MKFKIKWSKESKKQRQISLLHLLITHHVNSSENFMELVEAGREGIFASTDIKYSYAIFGRDSIEVSEDLLDSQEQLARDVIMTLAGLQGVQFNERDEEEPGKIHHEYRSSYFAGHHVSEHSATILNNLQLLWGSDNKDDVIYYGSYDATPLYVRLVGRYVDKYGDDILKREYTGRDHHRHTIIESVEAAERWLVAKLNASPLGLLEFKQLNPNGITNQVWKDSGTSYLHLDGSQANHDKGIASIELQGYAYDALKTAARFTKSASKKQELHGLASHIQTTVIKKFWSNDENFFVEALDYDNRGHARQLKTLSSNGGVLLESNLLRDLPGEESKKYTEGVAVQVYSQQFLTSAGIRSRALKYKELPGFVDYHGSYTVWPKETYDIAQGLRNAGLQALAEQLENRILVSIQAAGEFYEFFYVDEDGNVYGEKKDVQSFLKQKHSEGSPIPEKGQAWVISAVLAIEARRSNGPPLSRPTGFEGSILSKVPSIEPESETA